MQEIENGQAAHEALRKEMENILNGFGGKRILVAGDVMLDSYWWGKVDRISPEAPVPIIHVQGREYRLGGAANVALNLVRLGAKPTLCTVIGEDAEGTVFLELLEKEGIGTEGIIRAAERPTTVKTRIIGNRSQMLRIDSEWTTPLLPPEREELVKKALSLLPETELVLFEDYDKGVLDAESISAIIQVCQSMNVPTAVDPKRRNFMAYKGSTLFKPNLRELIEGMKLDLDSKASIEELNEAVQMLRSQMQLDTVLLTLSERGVLVVNAKEKSHIPAHLRSVSDVSGAGDTVISVAALAHLVGASPRAMAELANLAGGLVCEKAGVVPIEMEELRKELGLEF